MRSPRTRSRHLRRRSTLGRSTILPPPMRRAGGGTLNPDAPAPSALMADTHLRDLVAFDKRARAHHGGGVLVNVGDWRDATLKGRAVKWYSVWTPAALNWLRVRRDHGSELLDEPVRARQSAPGRLSGRVHRGASGCRAAAGPPRCDTALLHARAHRLDDVVGERPRKRHLNSVVRHLTDGARSWLLLGQ